LEGRSVIVPVRGPLFKIINISLGCTFIPHEAMLQPNIAFTLERARHFGARSDGVGAFWGIFFGF